MFVRNKKMFKFKERSRVWFHRLKAGGAYVDVRFKKLQQLNTSIASNVNKI